LTEDGRRFLAHSPIRYNLMVSDVYYSLYSVPIHFTTREFFALARQRLADGGLFIANVIGDLAAEPPSLIASEVKTFRSVFPNSYFFAADSPEQRAAQNIIFVGVNGTRAFDISTSSLAAFSDPLLRSIPARRIAPETLNLDVHPVLTDDFAPVEYLTAATLRRNSVR
ncbi:MAG: fused MFS/spermidine synthase, partial [Candidatus Harrisonbacteria bacterium]|nr:fused MFS/spermidine synthase [Candidatus Harrisonbacteria bacterium]